MQITEQNTKYNCPICNSKNTTLHRWYELDALKAEWSKGFGFIPRELYNIDGQLEQLRCHDCELKFYHPSICGDNAFYNEMSSRYSWYYEKDKWEFDIAVDFICKTPSVNNILEVGCGEGHFLRRLSHKYKCRGVELNQSAINKCLKLGLNVSSDDISTFNETFDVIAAFEVIEHISAPRNFLERLVKSLKEGGYLILAVPDPNSYLLHADNVLLDMPPHHVISFSKKTLEMIGSELGLECLMIQQEPLRLPHFKSLLSNYINMEQTQDRGSLRRKIKERISGYDTARLIYEAQKNVINAMIPLSYFDRMDNLKGQTHMAFYRKF